MVDLRQRIDFSFNVTVLDVEVEKATVATPTGNTLVSASVEEIGPPKMAVTWAFLTSVAILASLYAMPFHRLARLVSTPYKRFTSTELARYFQFVARQLLPLYVYLGMRLADAPVISGDDTTSKVLMVSKALEEKEQDPNTEMPWDSYATPEKAQYTIRQQEEARNRATKQREQAARELGGVPGRKHPRLPPRQVWPHELRLPLVLPSSAKTATEARSASTRRSSPVALTQIAPTARLFFIGPIWAASGIS